MNSLPLFCGFLRFFIRETQLLLTQLSIAQVLNLQPMGRLNSEFFYGGPPMAFSVREV